MRTLDPHHAKRFLAAAKGDRLEALYVLALTTGMHFGELLALRWNDVDLKGSLAVRGTLLRSRGSLTIAEPKTAGSRRHVSIGKLAIEAVQRPRYRARILETWSPGESWRSSQIGRQA